MSENTVTTTIRNIPKSIYKTIKARALKNGRFINKEIIAILGRQK
jgi:plasmid stability protein